MREAALSSLTLTHELSESAANKQTNLVFRGSASAKSSTSKAKMQRNIAVA